LKKCAHFLSLRSENINVGKNTTPFLKNIDAIDSDKTGKEMENIDGVPNIDYRCLETIDASISIDATSNLQLSAAGRVNF